MSSRRLQLETEMAELRRKVEDLLQAELTGTREANETAKQKDRLISALLEIARYGAATHASETPEEEDHRLKLWARRVLREVRIEQKWTT